MQTEKHTTRKSARDAGEKRYYGALCAKHPEDQGERNAKNGNCISCSREKMRLRRAENPEYHRRATRAAWEKWYPKNKHKVSAYQRHRNTGIDDGTYKRLLEIQGNKCAICAVSFDKARSHADHCHDTKKPRGILCSTCNQAEGLIKRSGVSPVDFGMRLSIYLSMPPARKLEEN